MAKKKATTPLPNPMVNILVCKCNSCTHWEIVKDAAGFTHLLCKTCGRVDECDITLHPHMPAHWVKRKSE